MMQSGFPLRLNSWKPGLSAGSMWTFSGKENALCCHEV